MASVAMVRYWNSSPMRWNAALRPGIRNASLLVGRSESGVDGDEHNEEVEGADVPGVLGHNDHVLERSLLDLEEHRLLPNTMSLCKLTVAATTPSLGFSP